jgi:microcystin-dependent protein
MTTLYYIFPFGENADDLTAIPSSPAIDGSVSYSDGWTDPYELDLLTNPAALPIPRGQMNQLLFDITNNIQEYQQFGSPNFITSSDNGGSPFPYPIYARVYYMGQVYENQVAANTATPGTDTTWLQLSDNAQGNPPGTVIDFAGAVVPAGYLLCDGSQVSRTTYSILLSAISFSQTGTLTNTMNSVTGLSTTASMYVGMAVEGANIPSGTTVASIVSGTAITLSAAATGSGATLITFFNWGNGNGTTTFNVPDMRRRASIGVGGSGAGIPGNVTGQVGGVETFVMTEGQLAPHNHPGSTVAAGVLSGTTGFGETLANGRTHPVSVATDGSGDPISLIQPSAVLTKCIKF